MAYVDNLVILTTHIKNEQKGTVDDFRDAEIIERLRPKLNKAAQLGNNTITFFRFNFSFIQFQRGSCITTRFWRS